MSFILALDQGTTSSRAILFDLEGSIEAVAQEEFPQHFPEPGWVEHDPLQIWESQRRVAQKVLAEARLNSSDIAAIGITNQRETAIVWERESGLPVSNAIVWQDRRTAATCEKLNSEGHLASIREKTGLLLDPYFSGTKVKWILDHVDGAKAKAIEGKLAFGTVDSWLIWKLTDGRLHITDATNASRTLLYNIHTSDWDDELLDILSIPRSMLPEVRTSSEVYGEISGIDSLKGVSVGGIAGDQQAALFGQACFEPGMAKNTYGTGCFLLMNTGRESVASENNLLTTVAWKIGERAEYALEGSVFVGGAVIQWLRDELGIIRSAPEVEALASSVPDSGGAFLVPAFTGLGAPHWDPYARGTLIGITRGTSAAHIARAALDSIAFQSADVLDAMQKDAKVDLGETRVDGGACRNDLLMQFQADLLQVPVVRPKVTETTALGAAYLAGLASGFWESTDTIARQWSIDRTFEPRRSKDEIDALRNDWNRAVERAKGWAVG